MTQVKTKDGTVLVGDKVIIETIGDFVWFSFYDRKGNCVKGNAKDFLHENDEIESIESIEINGKVFVARG